MEFVLNEYHRNISDEELIADIMNVANKLQKETITTDEYDKSGRYNYSTIIKRFGGWNTALQKAGLSVSRVVKRNPNNIRATNEEMIADVKRVAELLNKGTITTTEYTKYGKHGYAILSMRFGTWENVLAQAGLCETGFHHAISENELLKEIERIWVILGRQPTSGDIKRGISKYSLNSYARKFGSWRNALLAFIDYINSEDKDNKETSAPTYNQESFPKAVRKKEQNHKTARDIDLRLRFKVMKRDNFKCCACGASPAKDPSVELHVDHIIPWSKGGETVIENLQTLCSKCNLGKSDLMPD